MSSTLGNFHRRSAALVAVNAAVFVAIALLASITRATELPASLPALPDGRGYEKVSPSNNDDGNVYAAWPSGLSNESGYSERPYYAAPSGNAVAYIAEPSEEGGIGREGEEQGNQYLARRDAEGRWEATNVMPPSDGFFTVPGYQAFNVELTAGLLTTNAGVPLVEGAPSARYRVPYMRNFTTGSYESLMSVEPPNRGIYEFGMYGHPNVAYESEPLFAGGTADFSHVLYMANDALTPEAVDGGEEDNNLYEFSNGALRSVNILPDGQPEPNAVFGGPKLVPREMNDPDFSNVISQNGSRIFWTGQGANKNIYMREDGTRTVQVDAGVGGGGQYWTATPTGTKVLFTKAGSLYEYDVENKATRELVAEGQVQGVLGTSEDLSYVYFAANGALASGASPGSCVTEDLAGGQCSLYVFHEGQPIRYISALSSRDDVTHPSSSESWDGDWQAGLGQRGAEVTADGHQVLFGSVLSLTGYDSHEHEELYVYEYEDGALHCVSCDHAGAPSAAPSQWSAYLPVSHQATYENNWMSSDGSRVFFDSLDSLVPQDTNGKNDVYEWERHGSGTCAEAEGCIYLISGGTAGEGNYLIGTSASGDDVFFTTRAKLVPEDENENIDVYDAHVGVVAPPVSSQCTGTGCQGAPSAPAVFSTPASVTYYGVGNFPPAVVKSQKAQAKKGRAKKSTKKKGRPKKKGIGKKRGTKKENGVKGKRVNARAHKSAERNGRSN